MSLRFSYRLRKPTNRTSLHFLHRVLAHPCFIFYLVSLSSLHILLHAPSLFSHLFSLFLFHLSLYSCFIFALLPLLLIFQVHSLTSLRPPPLPFITVPLTAQVFITCWTAHFGMMWSDVLLWFLSPLFQPHPSIPYAADMKKITHECQTKIEDVRLSYECVI